MDLSRFQFPEKNSFLALSVTKPDFAIQNFPDWEEKLWVDFGPVRGKNLFKRIRKSLGMQGDDLAVEPPSPLKMVLSGHRGCGKSVELVRFVEQISHPGAYWTVFVDLEQETNIDLLQAEDFYIALITILVHQIEEEDLGVSTKEIEALLDEWLAEEEVKKEIRQDFKVEVGTDVGVGASLLKFFSAKGNLKNSYSRDNLTTRTLRTKIKANPQRLVTGLNLLLLEVRNKVIAKGLGRELIFIVDGFEKSKPEVYRRLFIEDPRGLTNIQAHLLCTVPISTFYDIESQDSRDLFETYYLPMVRIDDVSRKTLQSLILKRVDGDLFEAGTLDRLIDYCGGCPRILLKLVNRSLLDTDHRITMEIVEGAIQEEGVERFRTLTSSHQQILRKGEFDSSNPEVLELLRSLNLLEYNGSNIERKVNPLIEGLLKDG